MTPKLPIWVETGNTVTLILYYTCIFLIKAGFAQFDISANKRPAVDTVLWLWITVYSPLSLPAFTSFHVLQSRLTPLPVVQAWWWLTHPFRTTDWWMMGRRRGRGAHVFWGGALWFDVKIEGGERWGRGGGAMGRVRTASTCRRPVHRDTNPS